MATTSGTDNDDILVGTSGVDTINGGAGNDIIDGGAGDDWLYGGLGNDTLDGGDGFDRIDFRDSLSAVVVDFGTGTATGQDIGTDTLQNIERVIGSDFDDSLTGSNTAAASYNWEEFTGGLGNDTIDGGGGNDEVWYGRSNASVHVDLSTGIVTGGEGTDQLTSIEWVNGSNFSDTLLGSENDEGFAPDAIGNIGAGVNFKVGGVDIIDGKGGIDTVYYDNTKDDGGFTPTGIEADLALGTVIDPAGKTDQLTSIENIIGSPYDDNIKGDSEANQLKVHHVEGNSQTPLGILHFAKISSDAAASMMIRPEEIHLQPPEKGFPGGSIVSIEFAGPVQNLVVRLDSGEDLRVATSPKRIWTEGESVSVVPEHFQCYDDSGERLDDEADLTPPT